MTTEFRVDLDAVAANWRHLDSLHTGETGAVIKADAYGLGAVPVARVLHAAGARTFFVANAQEGETLRPHLQDATIAVLNGAAEADRLAHARLTPVLNSLHDIALWRALGAQRGGTLPAFLHIDTGMSRLGLAPCDVARLIAEPALLGGVAITVVMSHLASAEERDNPQNGDQLRAFEQACRAFPEARTSFGNSSGMFLGAPFRSDLTRPGAALYGLNPTPGLPNTMRPAVRLRAQILQTRTIHTGERVGYGGTFAASKPMRIATVGIGYAGGYPRALSNRGEASFDGVRLPLLGRVSMDLATFDVTGAPGAVQGEWLDLLGPALPPDDLAGMAGMIGYELITALGPRNPRIYAPL